MKNTIGERIKYAREKKGLLQAQLAELIGVKSPSVISNWEKGTNKPDAEKIVALCKALDISASYLLDFKAFDEQNFSPVEIEIIKKYRVLDEHGHEAVQMIINHEYKRCITIKSSNIDKDNRTIGIETIRLTMYSQSVSAGDGIPLWDQEDAVIDVIEVPDTPTTRCADFALRVSGNSMEPKFYDGDIVLIKKTDYIEIGDIGIFIVDGEGYIKKLGKNKLISLNANYKDILFTEYTDVHCVGKVIGSL